MSVRFTLEKRTNVYGESPIRLSWSFGGRRYQSTLGFSIHKANWDDVKKLVTTGLKSLFFFPLTTKEAPMLSML